MTGESAASDSDHGWRFDEKSVVTLSTNATIKLWLQRRNHNQWPRAGGWLDQPLAALTCIDTLDFVERTYRAAFPTDGSRADWSTLTSLQADLIRWIESDGD